MDQVTPTKGRVDRCDAIKRGQILNGLIAPECCAKVTEYQFDRITKISGFT